MEKIIYLTKVPLNNEAPSSFSTLKQKIASLQNLGAHRIFLNIVDEDVKAAEGLRITRDNDPINAVITLWVDSSTIADEITKSLKEVSTLCHGYLVCESEPLPNTNHLPTINHRTFGMNQIALLEQPSRLTTEQWLHLWQKDHTTVAIETQATFAYKQNWVVRSLTQNAPKIDAIVEESFPPECMTDRQAFFASPNNPQQYKDREQRMIESCARFIDFDKMECYPMSQYYLAQ